MASYVLLGNVSAFRNGMLISVERQIRPSGEKPHMGVKGMHIACSSKQTFKRFW